jgi:hypothetical protein
VLFRSANVTWSQLRQRCKEVAVMSAVGAMILLMPFAAATVLEELLVWGPLSASRSTMSTFVFQPSPVGVCLVVELLE